jgi:hypothetical protein
LLSILALIAFYFLFPPCIFSVCVAGH